MCKIMYLATLAVSSVSTSVNLSESLANTSVLQASEAVSLMSNMVGVGSAGRIGTTCSGGTRNDIRSCCSTISLSEANTSVDQVSDTIETVSSPEKNRFL